MSAAVNVLDALRDWGVHHVFCCPGTSEIPLLDALAARGEGEPAFILTTDEAISVSMADGFARASGQVGVAYLHTNVGLANGLAHLYAAQVARSPLGVIVGVKGTRTLPHRALTTSPRILETAAPYAGHTWQNLNADDLVDDVDRMLRRATIAPESPSVLAIPQDHLSATVEVEPAAGPRRVPEVRPSEQDLRTAASLLQQARHPVIIAGSDVARRGGQDALARIGQALSAPVFVESRRDLERWAFPTDHPCFAGVFDPNDAVVADSDLIVLAGAPTPIAFTAEAPSLPPGIGILHISEDADEIGRRTPPAAALVGQTRLVLEELAPLVESGPAPQAEAVAFLERARQHRRQSLRRWREQATGTDDFSAAEAMRVFADAVGGTGLLVVDAVTSTLPLLRFVERTEPDSLFATASGSLGWGMGAAAGVALARRSRVRCVVGDGVVQFGVAAFWTVRRYAIPVTFIVVNNGRYQAVISGLSRSGGAAAASGSFPLTDISGLDIAALAASFGIASTRVDSAAAFTAALEEDATRGPDDGPHLIEVMVSDRLWP